MKLKNTSESLLIRKSDSVDSPTISNVIERPLDEGIIADNSLPMVILNEENMYNVEGFAQLDEKNIHFYDNKQLHYDQIEDYEIIETNREYNYYIKHFFDRVTRRFFVSFNQIIY